MAGTCGAMYGGRRRSRRRPARRSRKMRGGNGYGFGEPITAGTLAVVPNMPSSTSGAPVVGPPTTGVTAMGGRRRSRKRKSLRARHRSMRGGGSPSSVGYSFAGDGQSGLANHSAYNANGAPGGAFAIPTGTR